MVSRNKDSIVFKRPLGMFCVLAFQFLTG